MTTTDKLLGQLNGLKGLTYPDVGYSYFADVKGDGTNNKSIYTIVNENGGVAYSEMNALTSRARCEKIRAKIRKLEEE